MGCKNKYVFYIDKNCLYVLVEKMNKANFSTDFAKVKKMIHDGIRQYRAAVVFYLFGDKLN